MRTKVGRAALSPPGKSSGFADNCVQIRKNPPIEVGFFQRRLEGKPPYLTYAYFTLDLQHNRLYNSIQSVNNPTNLEVRI